MSGFAFPDQAFARRCMMCGFTQARNEWDETPALQYCPRCGIELERLACRECGAPLTFVRDEGFLMMFGGAPRPSPFCGYCGEPACPPHEAKRRDKPNPKGEQAGSFGEWLIRLEKTDGRDA